MASKPYYLRQLDISATMKNFRENVPKFWESKELMQSLEDGSFLATGPLFFVRVSIIPRFQFTFPGYSDLACTLLDYFPNTCALTWHQNPCFSLARMHHSSFQPDRHPSLGMPSRSTSLFGDAFIGLSKEWKTSWLWVSSHQAPSAHLLLHW